MTSNDDVYPCPRVMLQPESERLLFLAVARERPSTVRADILLSYDLEAKFCEQCEIAHSREMVKERPH